MGSRSLLVILSVYPARRQHIDAHYFRQQLPASWLSLLFLVVHIYRQAYVSLAYHNCVLFLQLIWFVCVRIICWPNGQTLYEADNQ